MRVMVGANSVQELRDGTHQSQRERQAMWPLD